jgi:hypothetical protein
LKDNTAMTEEFVEEVKTTINEATKDIGDQK